MLEAAVKRDFLSQSFETAKELIGSGGHSYAADGSFIPGSFAVLPWIPRTTAAVALRLLEFDASLSYTIHQRLGAQRDKETDEFVSGVSSKLLCYYSTNYEYLKCTSICQEAQTDMEVVSAKTHACIFLFFVYLCIISAAC